MKKANIQNFIYTTLLLLLLQFLYMENDGTGWKTEKWQGEASRISIGFPCHSINYTTLDMQGTPYEIYPEKDKWSEGIAINYLLLIIDIVSLVALFFVLYTVIPTQVLHLIFKGCFLGIIAGCVVWGILRLDEIVLFSQWVFVPIMVFLFFITLPIITLWISYHSQLPKTGIFLISIFAVSILCFTVNRLDNTELEMGDFIALATYFTIIFSECLLYSFIRKRFCGFTR